MEQHYNDMEIRYFDVSELKNYERNPKKHPQSQIDNLVHSLRRFGWRLPCLVDFRNMVLIAGHGRVAACKKVMKERPDLRRVPCIDGSDMSDSDIEAFRYLDNKLAESEWDMDILITDLPTLDLSGFDLDFGLTDDDEDPTVAENDDYVEENVETRAQRGHVYQLGRHRLMCGDSTSSEDVLTLMGGGEADMILTDPPYNVEIVGGSHAESVEERKRKGALTIANDSMSDDEFKIFLHKVFKNAHDVLKAGGVFYVWYASREVVNFQTAIMDSGLTVKQELVWNKNSLVMGRQDYQWKHEPCLYGWKETAAHNWYGDRKQTTVIDFDRPTTSELHPTMKPVGLFDYQMRNSSRVGEIVLDLFCGSGTTIIAAEQNGRIGYCMEYDPKYCDVIIDRWEKLTGLKAEDIT